MNQVDKSYFELLNLVLTKGRWKKNRTGIKTLGIFGEQAKFELYPNFPILTTKKVWFKGVVHESLWFLSGSTNIKYLVDNGVGIWTEWALKRYNDKMGHLGKCNMEHFESQIMERPEFAKQWGELGEGTYGGMWRAFPYNTGLTHLEPDACAGTVDQLQKVLDKLKTNPDDRRMIVSAWHPYWVDHCALPPCHCLFQFHTEELTWQERRTLCTKMVHVEEGYHDFFDRIGVPKRRLNCQLYQRSCDLFLGIPWNISSYSLLTCMIAQVVNMLPGTFTHTFGDAHIYENHIEQVNEQLRREPKTLPTLWLNPSVTSLFDFKYEDIKLENYDPHPSIRAEVAI